jgi:hypothetical protein
LTEISGRTFRRGAAALLAAGCLAAAAVRGAVDLVVDVAGDFE